LAKILVVDDDPAVQMTIRLLLERARHGVTVAGDGQKGLSAFESEDFDLLFLDIFMPEWMGSRPCGTFTGGGRQFRSS
jgi:CheY-like chemotaxis protein